MLNICLHGSSTIIASPYRLLSLSAWGAPRTKDKTERVGTLAYSPDQMLYYTYTWLEMDVNKL